MVVLEAKSEYATYIENMSNIRGSRNKSFLLELLNLYHYTLLKNFKNVLE